MVWRDNIKVLEIKAKALPFMISAVFHALILFAFTAVNQGKERVFNKAVVEALGKQKGLKKQLTEKVAFVYSYWTPELEVRGSKSYSTKEIKAMKDLHHEGAVFMAFCF